MRTMLRKERNIAPGSLCRVRMPDGRSWQGFMFFDDGECMRFSAPTRYGPNFQYAKENLKYLRKLKGIYHLQMLRQPGPYAMSIIQSAIIKR